MLLAVPDFDIAQQLLASCLELCFIESRVLSATRLPIWKSIPQTGHSQQGLLRRLFHECCEDAPIVLDDVVLGHLSGKCGFTATLRTTESDDFPTALTKQHVGELRPWGRNTSYDFFIQLQHQQILINQCSGKWTGGTEDYSVTSCFQHPTFEAIICIIRREHCNHGTRKQTASLFGSFLARLVIVKDDNNLFPTLLDFSSNTSQTLVDGV